MKLFQFAGSVLWLACAWPALAHEGHSHEASATVQSPPRRTTAPSTSMRKPRPQLGSDAVFAPDGALWLAGLDAQGRLFVQHTPPGALAPWSEPRLLPQADKEVSADGENRPKLAFGPNGWAVISYTQPQVKPYTGFIRMMRSSDGGQNFAAPVTVHADRQIITHRFESIAFDAKGALHTVWIDKRDLEASAAAGSGTADKKKASYRGAAIYRNVSLDGGATFGPDTKMADHTCECCRVAFAQGPDGQLRAIWRHVFEPNIRDHAFAVLNANVSTSTLVRATQDDWRIDGCPHHGPGLARAAEGGYHAVWFGQRQVNGQAVAAVRYGRLQATGEPIEATVQALPDPAAEHADVRSHGQRVAIAWRSFETGQTVLRAWVSSDNGAHFVLRELGRTALDNDHPRMAQVGERVVVVWRNSEEVKVYEIAF